MKCFQSQFQCMKDQLITVGHIQGIPSDIYPNSEISGYHDFYELEFFTAGEGIHYINGVPYHVQPGYVYLLIPGDFHRMQLDPRYEYNMWNLKLAVEVPSKELSEELHRLPRPLCACLDAQTAAFFENELRFLDTCLQGSWNNLMAKNSADRLLTVAHFAFANNTPPSSVFANDPIYQVIQYVEKNYPQEIPLSQVAVFLHLSENYAGVYFKNATGLHFSEYLNRTRLFHAMKMLRETGCTIKEIAYAVGFHSPEYLARLFTASFGVSPREYRRSFDRL